VLAAAARAGRVEHFSWRQPTLTELFREAVTDADERAAPADGGRDRQGVRV
jgi:ABC-2 type transport system ATP-binding protein